MSLISHFVSFEDILWSFCASLGSLCVSFGHLCLFLVIWYLLEVSVSQLLSCSCSRVKDVKDAHLIALCYECVVDGGSHGVGVAGIEPFSLRDLLLIIC